jgi:hypothetical protein
MPTIRENNKNVKATVGFTVVNRIKARLEFRAYLKKWYIWETLDSTIPSICLDRMHQGQGLAYNELTYSKINE